MSEDDAKRKDGRTPAEEEVDRDAILARRARFVATALAGLTGLTACDPRPQPCLEIAPLPPRTAPSTEATAMPCLSPLMEHEDPPDAGAPRPCLDVAPPPSSSSTTSPTPSASGSAAPAPSPCLSLPMPSSRPQPCLAPPPNRPTGDGKK